MATTVSFPSEAHTLQADLFGDLPARRAVAFCHGQSWDALGWRAVAPRFAERGIPALAVNLRGYDGSTGKTNRYTPGKPWTPVTDLRAAIAYLRRRGVAEVGLVGASMGGSAALAAATLEDVECVVTVSAPVRPVPDALSAKVRGRKLYVCAIDDTMQADEAALASFRALKPPKQLVFFGGKEHSKAMFVAPYGPDVIKAIVDFVAKGL